MSERQEVIERLQAVSLGGGSREGLSNIARAVYEPHGGWTIGACGALRQRLISFLSETDEEALREAYIKGREDGMGMANAKDAQAEYLRGKNDGYDEGYDVGFASADDWCAQHEDAMAEHGWYRAVDMYKKPVLIGDMMQGMRSGGGWCEPFKVVRIDFNGHDWVAYEDANKGHLLSKCRHYHAPTVEDLLRDMHAKLDEVTALYVGEAIDSDERDSDEARIFAEYATKLRLAGSDAE